jgi:hypothetical protein
MSVRCHTQILTFKSVHGRLGNWLEEALCRKGRPESQIEIADPILLSHSTIETGPFKLSV